MATDKAKQMSIRNAIKRLAVEASQRAVEQGNDKTVNGVAVRPRQSRRPACPNTIGTVLLEQLAKKGNPMDGMTQPFYENVLIAADVVVLDEVSLKPESGVMGFRGRC
jgi:hypothetical protein